jgi:hypothetical protein
VTHNLGLHFALELGNPLRLTHRQLARERRAGDPVLRANALGMDDAARWFKTGRRAHHRVATAERDRTHHFGFAHYLNPETETHQEPTLPVVAAFEATKALHEIVRWDVGVDLDEFFDCALRACSRGRGHLGSRPVAAAATA